MLFLIYEVAVDLTKRPHLNLGEVLMVALAHLHQAYGFFLNPTNPASVSSRGRQEISNHVAPVNSGMVLMVNREEYSMLWLFVAFHEPTV